MENQENHKKNNNNHLSDKKKASKCVFMKFHGKASVNITAFN